MIYYLGRRILARHEQGQTNPEAAKRLETILAERDEEYAAYHDSSDSESESSSSSEKVPRKPHSSRRTLPPTRPKITLTTYEQAIASEVVQPASIPVSFADIGGLDPIIADLQESIIYPLTLPSLYRQSNLLSAPSGVLLYGPPGCGKTMLAKALARESGAVFINLHISTLTEKWYGDSNKLVAAVFSLARKLAPAIVFVDEIDAVLGTRRSSDHEASGMVKAEMMTHWDGLASADTAGRPQQVLILGATNRPQDIDEAILRRMPKRFAIGLPDEEQRRRIFKLVLRDAHVDTRPTDESDGSSAFDLEWLVKMSGGMSGSDIKECCREAALLPMREMIQARKARGERLRGTKPRDLRGLRTEDFMPYLAARMKMSADVMGAGSAEEMQKLLERAKREVDQYVKSEKKRKPIQRRGSIDEDYESVEGSSEDESRRRRRSGEKRGEKT